MSAAPTELNPSSSAEEIYAAVSRRQFLRPHRSVQDVLTELGICPAAVAQAVQWLEIDASRPLGRLRASELMQLSRCVHRLWEQAAASRIPQAT